MALPLKGTLRISGSIGENGRITKLIVTASMPSTAPGSCGFPARAYTFDVLCYHAPVTLYDVSGQSSVELTCSLYNVIKQQRWFSYRRATLVHHFPPAEETELASKDFCATFELDL